MRDWLPDPVKHKADSHPGTEFLHPTAQQLLVAFRLEVGRLLLPGGLRTVDATLAPDGSYSWTEALPSSVRSVSVEAQVGGGIRHGSHNTFAYFVCTRCVRSL